MKTIATLCILTAGLLGVVGQASSSPGVPEMASIAYKVPQPRIDASVQAMRRDLRVADADIPKALGILAHCGKTGMVEYGDLVDGIVAAAPAWNAAMHDDGIEKALGIERDGLLDVHRLCRTFEIVRRGHGSSSDTIDTVVITLKDRSKASVAARTMIGEIGPIDVDGDRMIRADYAQRLKTDA